LKKRDHYHCIDCSQAFSDPARLRAHISRHGIKLAKNDGGAAAKGVIVLVTVGDWSLKADCGAMVLVTPGDRSGIADSAIDGTVTGEMVLEANNPLEIAVDDTIG
jgi:hypothetical protein